MKKSASPPARSPRKTAAKTAVKTTGSQSSHVQRARREHAAENAQDYVEAISDLISETGEARAIDLAKRLGLTHVTVGRTVQRLQREGLVTAQPYRSIFLTPEGERLAKESRHRHQVVIAFLKHLGVPDAIAEADAEGLEHHVSAETLAAFERLMSGAR